MNNEMRNKLALAKAQMIADGFEFVCSVMSGDPDDKRFGSMFCHEDGREQFVNIDTVDAILASQAKRVCGCGTAHDATTGKYGCPNCNGDSAR